MQWHRSCPTDVQAGQRLHEDSAQVQCTGNLYTVSSYTVNAVFDCESLEMYITSF